MKPQHLIRKNVAALLLLGIAVPIAACGNNTIETTASNTTFASVTTRYPIGTAPHKEPSTEPVVEKSLLPRQAATEGMVLLKNEDNVLPLKKDSTVAVFGKGQVDLIKGGTGSGDVRTEHVVGLLEGLLTKMSEKKVTLYTALAKEYNSNSSYSPSASEIKQAAKSADTAIYVITRNSGEGSDRSATAGDYYLSDAETAMIESLIKGGFENIVVVLNVGGIVDTTKLLSYPEIKSILLAWQPGQDGGDAIADLLVGDVTPSGKLSDTFAKSYDDYPSSAGFNESVDYVNYTEDIFVGYRYFETFDPTYSKVNFEFGYGLSYTTFEYSDVNFTENDGEMTVSVKVKNTGEYSGKEVVQLYFSAPQGKLGKPGKELCAFAKTSTLAPGASETVTLRFDMDDLSSYDDTGKVQKSAYIMEAGDYNFYLGNSIKNAGEAGVRYTYTVDETVVVEQLTEEMTAKLLEERLLADGTYENIFSDSDISIPIGTDLIKIEAETYYAKHCHAQVVFNSDATQCGIKMLTSTEGNRYVTFAVDAPEAGNWRIALGIGNENGNISNAVHFSVNDVAQTNSSLALPNTNGIWNTVETGSATVTLKKGVNFIRVEFVCGDAFQGVLNYITLEKGDGTNASSEMNASNLSSTVSSTGINEKVDGSAASASAASKKEIITFDELMADPTLMEAFIDQLTVEQMVYLLHGHGENVPHGTGTIGGLVEYGIPSAESSDGPAGINLYENTTAWPVETLMACTWNTELMTEVGKEIAAEATKYKVDIWLAPGSNIHRNPLCGRNFEYYSEDPYLSGTIAAALINGVQGGGVGVMIKHFVCNEKETNRGYSDSRVSERAIREIYLRPFEIAVKTANPWAIMTSYNKVNGVETAENPSLLTNILRGEWNYDGIVSSDWWNDSVQYKELLAGQSLKMKSGDEAGVLGAYKSGILSREDIESHVQRVLELVMKTNAPKRVSEDSAIEISGDEKTVMLSIDSTWKSSEIGMEECKDKNGTYNTTNTYDGQWMVFVIDVKKSGNYKVELRVASPDGSGTINFFVDDVSAGNFRNTTKTGDWQQWEKSNGSLTLNLTEGVHQLKLSFTRGGFNLNTITLIPE